MNADADARELRSYASLEAYESEVPVESRRHRVESALAIRIHRTLERSRSDAWTERVLEASADHSIAFGSQASLGIAWYTHLEEGRARAYFERAAESDACVRRHVPGFQHAFLDLVGRALGMALEARKGHAGPGIHVFAAHGPCARLGGEVHFDTEGLPPPYLKAHGPAYTAVLSLSAVSSGGGLRLWDLPYDGHEDPALAKLREPVVVAYAPGDLVLFESYRLHQIEPFGGEAARVSATCHVARLAGQWVAWF